MEKYTISCKDCEFVCRAKATMNKHIEKVHPNTSNLDFKCNVCNQGFFSQIRLDNHVLQEHDGRNHFECDNCDFKCIKKDQLVNHTCSQFYHCAICEASFDDDYDLRHHFQIIHEGKNPNKPMPHWPSGKILHCHDCKYQSKDYKGAKYLGFFSSHSLKTREKYISFAQFVYFLREVCLLFNF